MHDKHADLAVCDRKDDLHLFVRGHIRRVPCRLSVAGAGHQTVQVAEEFCDFIANKLADVGVFKVERLATERAEIHVHVLSVHVDCNDVGVFNDVLDLNHDLG